MPKSRTTSTNDRAPDEPPRTRGGWTPVGTAAGRRANQDVNITSRGLRSRQRLIDAARRVFERVGYIDATIDDIVTEAGVARGSFYTYFPDKLSIFQVVARNITEAVLAAVATESVNPELDPIQRLDASNRNYIATYRQNAKIYGLVEQVATIDPVVHTTRLEGRAMQVERIASTIRRWQRRGLADPALEPDTTAALLVSMTSNFCYWWLVGGEDHDDEQAAAALTATWVRATGLRKRPRPTWLDAAAK